MAQKIRVAIATNSLGKPRAGHTIEQKLQAVRKYRYDGIEVAMECLEVHSQASEFAHHSSRRDRLLAAASDIHKKAANLSLEIVALNPFGAYDGLANEGDVEERLKEGTLWLQICDALHCPILQIASCIYPLQKTLTTDPAKIAANMRKLALLAQKYDKVVAYEGVVFGTNVNTWQQVHDTVRRVNLPNLRHCVDTFHIAAKEAGDPFNTTAPVKPDGQERLRNSLIEFKQKVRADDIGYLQLSDATVADRLQRGYPLRDLNQLPWMTQSRNCRIFPCEHGVLPALDVAKAVFETGYRGWVSMEVFHPDLFMQDDRIPDEWAKRGMDSWGRVAKYCFGNTDMARL